VHRSGSWPALCLLPGLLLSGAEAQARAAADGGVDAGVAPEGRVQRQAALRAEAEKAYHAKRYSDAAALYRLAATGAPGPEGDLYNEACAWALAGSADRAFAALDAAAGGLADVTLLQSDADLALLRADARWARTLAAVQGNRRRLADPERVQIRASDVSHFWAAHDAAAREPGRLAELLQRLYLDAGSAGLDDYFTTKILALEKLLDALDRYPRFYAAARGPTLTLEQAEPRIRALLRRFRELYAEAVFQDVTLVIGRLSSAGTASSHGLLIGAEYFSRTPQTPVEELPFGPRNVLRGVDALPPVVIHELVHFNQRQLTDPRLLAYAIREGSADFVTELVAGAVPSPSLRAYGEAHQAELWAAFQKDMHGKESGAWMANNATATPDHPADLGYYLGYKIAEAFYARASDKRRAVAEIIQVTDFDEFLARSAYADKMRSPPGR
jgi:hypothetical protein